MPSPPPPSSGGAQAIDQKELHRVAQDIQTELFMLQKEQDAKHHGGASSSSSSSSTPRRFWHKFTRFNRKSTPLISRPWVPWVLVGSLVAIWTPDSYKINLLYALDDWHAGFKLKVHCWYWRMTMEPEKYALLMEQMEKNMPKSKRVQSPNCPL